MGALDIKFTPSQAYPLGRRGPLAIGGAYEGASRVNRELATWSPVIRSADQDLNWDKLTLDARSRDIARNDGYVAGALATHRDSIVGTVYRLNAQPNWRVLGADETWAEEFQTYVEQHFTLWAESPQHWVDASRINTLTGLVRLAVGSGVLAGEALSTVEWLRDDDAHRPVSTAIQMVDLDRLSNPNEEADQMYLRRGIEKNHNGAPIAYHIRTSHPSEFYSDQAQQYAWKRVPTRKPWGRLQVIHLYEQLRPDQSRGVGEMVSVLKEMKMTRRFRDIVLQNAVVNATYAAAVESELPTETLWEQLGSGTGDNGVERYLTQLSEYMGAGQGIHIDGAKIPHLFPGTKLNLKPMGTPGGVGTEFETSLLRYAAASLGLSYEQFSKDYTKTNYSSARAGMVETWKYMQSRKKLFADRFATAIYSLWLEEQINKKKVPLPAGRSPMHFYDGLNREAYCKCDWIGASRGQIDELKETQAADLRVKSGFSTFEKECARNGDDFREVFAQRKREKAMLKEMGIEIVSDTVAVAGMKQQQAANDQPAEKDDEE